jgi:hypothetical protein
VAFIWAFVALFMGGCSAVVVVPPAESRLEMQAVRDFEVTLSPWTNGKTQVEVANVSNNYYTWVLLSVAFVDESGNIVKTVDAGTYSHIDPEGSVKFYLALDEPEKIMAHVYAVQNDYLNVSPVA